jgi:hypothetical protein
MGRWVALIAAIAAIFVTIHIGQIAYSNAQYRRVLKTYSDVLKPGMKRSEVENFIMSKHGSFMRECCVGPQRGTLDDLVKIAHEEEGWVCQRQVVYAAFEFAAIDPKRESVADPEDRLVRSSLYRSVCLDLP